MALLVSSLAAIAFAALLIVPAAEAHVAEGAAAPVVVRLRDSFFSPSRVALRPGGAVRFVWAGVLVHNLLGPGIPRRLENPVTRRRPFTRVFGRPGRFLFTCSIHPGMQMTVRVR